jgi:hypothetical protein
MPMTEATPTYACPWCPHTDMHLKKVLTHMESAHHQRWCDLALYPPTAGDEPKRKGGDES